MISDDNLLVICKNRREMISITDISILRIENKKLLFPLIAGGIVAPFALLSYFANFFHPLIHLVSIMAGLLSFYVGWSGKSSFTIKKKTGDELNYFLPSISQNLMAFTEYVNTLIKYPINLEVSNYLYFKIESDNLNAITRKSEFAKSKLFPIKGYTYNQIKRSQGELSAPDIVAIHPQKAGREIKFKYDSELHQMRPYLEGPVLPDSIVDRKSFQ